jgi:hypothetical protein
MMIAAQLAILYMALGIWTFIPPTNPPPAPPSSSVAGTWNDDPKNWYRAFEEEQPADVNIIHSQYWRSDHWTYEYMYFFEVQATPEWRDKFLKERNALPVPPDKARSFRTQVFGDSTPDWFAPDPVDIYEVWDERPGYFGTIWINKDNGHIYFWDSQL